MGRGVPLDLLALHELLWARRDRLGRLKLLQTDLAKEIGVTKFTMSRLVAKFITQQRIRQISNRGQNIGLFVVTDPALWTEQWGTDPDGWPT